MLSFLQASYTLDKGSSTINDMVQVGGTGRMEVAPGKVVVDAERHKASSLTVKECFAHSSNRDNQMKRCEQLCFGNRP